MHTNKKINQKNLKKLLTNVFGYDIISSVGSKANKNKKAMGV
jgi:hypothetical protein